MMTEVTTHPLAADLFRVITHQEEKTDGLGRKPVSQDAVNSDARSTGLEEKKTA